jgi:C4-dicarboxylate transporter DctM subunit
MGKTGRTTVAEDRGIGHGHGGGHLGDLLHHDRRDHAHQPARHHRTGLAPILTGLITDLGLSRIGFLLVLIVLYIVMGMFFDTLSMMLLTIPILLPTLETMGVSPLWFGVFVVLLGEFAMVTPPVGIIPYIVHSIAKNPEVNLGVTVTLRDIFVSLLWFLPVGVIFLILMVAVPGMTEWLPDLISRTSGGVSG